MKLTKTQCDKLEIREKSYKKFDGGGLYLEVTPKGAKLWRLKYYYRGKEKRLSLGAYPTVTLLNARQKREKAKRLLDEGIDPSKDRVVKKREAALKSRNTFEDVAREWHRKQENRWSEKRSFTVMSRLEKNVFSHLGSWPVADIKTVDLLSVLQIIEKRGAYETANRTKQICGQVFRYAIQTGRCEYNPVPSLQGALQTRKVKHFAAISASEIPELLKALHDNEAIIVPQTRHAILFSMLTFCRPTEIRHARWQDINIEERQWLIPEEFMKMDRSHIVPLSIQAIEVLERQRKLSSHINTPWVFHGRNTHRKPMSDGTVNMAIKRQLGFAGRMTAHGFRALARTTIREKLGYYPDVIEAQLAHKPLGALGAAYDRAQFLEERITMMQEWGDFVLDR